MTIRVSQLFIHPIKSAAGIAIEELALDELGAVHDRRWLLVDNDDRFITQREVGSLALIKTKVTPSGLQLDSKGKSAITVDTPPADWPTRDVVIWDDIVPAVDAGDVAAEWCSAVIRMPCRLVHLARQAQRPLATKYAGPLDPSGRHVSFSDGAPLLIVSESSLVTLNDNLAARDVSSVGFDRFRPNVVLSGSKSHEEDTWRTIEINGITIGVGSPCPRCVMTTVDQEHGIRASALRDEPGGEPLRTLATYRRQGSGVMFGMNATNDTPGIIRIGDEVTVRELR